MFEKIKIGIIGTGWWATENHIPILRQFNDIEVVAACGLGEENLRNVRERFGIPFVTEDYRRLLVCDGLSGVVIVSPHHLHFEHAAAALERGLHVLCEKPIALYGSEARKLAALAEARRLHFVIPYGWNYTDFAAETKRRVGEGAIGEIQHVHLHMASALRDLFSGTGAWFAEDAMIKPQRETWSDPTRGGGFGHGQLTHALGLLFWVTLLEPSAVFALLGTSETGADLFHAISCRFRNGATGVIGGAGTMPSGSTYQVDLRLFGTRGMLLLDIERPRLEIRRDDQNHLTLEMDHQPGAYACLQPVRTFLDLIRGNTVENRSPAAVGVHAVEVLDAAFRSARSRNLESV